MSFEVASADRLEPVLLVVRPKSSVVLTAVQAQLAASRVPGLLPGPVQQGPSPPRVGVTAINDEAVDVRGLWRLRPSHLLVFP